MITDDSGISIRSTKTKEHTNAPSERTFHIRVTESYLRKVLAFAEKHQEASIDTGVLIERLLRHYKGR